MKKPDLIGFDFDGTTGDSINHMYKVICRIFADYHKVPPNFEDYRLHFGEGAASFLSARGINVSYEKLYELYLKYLMEVHSKNRAKFFADAPQGFVEIASQNIAVGIVSAQIQEFVRSCLEDLTKQEFDSLRFISTSVRHKPTVFQMLRKDLNVKEGVCWYVGDTERDMRDAREAGYVPVAITRGFSSEAMLRNAGADYCVNDMSGLLALIAICEQS